MRKGLTVAAALAAMLLGTGLAAAQGQEEEKEKKVKMQDLPPAVQQAVKEQQGCQAARVDARNEERERLL